MKIIVNENVIYEGMLLQGSGIDELVNDELCKNNLVVDSILINGQKVEGDFEIDFAGHFKKDDVIEVKTLSKKSYLDDQLLTAHGYLQRAIPAAQAMVSELYQGPLPETWHSLSQILEGVEWLTQFIDEIQENKHLYSSWQSDITVEASFKEPLDNLVEGINNSDPVLIGDIVSYELLEILKTLSIDIEKTIKAEVPANELH